MSVLLEVCCGGVDDAIAAARGGADRIELNSGLSAGGLTPTLGELFVVEEHVHVPVVAMVRPREGGFCYSRFEFETMCCDACSIAETGVAGLCFAVLGEDGRVDAERCETLMRMVHRVNKRVEFVFSRAIDVVPDVEEALRTLVGLGFDRVLSSGQAPSAPEGAETLARMVRAADGRLDVVAAAGVTPGNVAALVGATGVGQVHGSFCKRMRDASCAGNPRVSFGAAADECVRAVCDERAVMDALVALGRGAEVDEMVATGV